MKYIHGIEAYITESLEDKKRDNYHCVLIAKNYDGVLELNQLVSDSYNRNDGHFYYMPRILYDDLEKTSDNIIISTACLGGIMNPLKYISMLCETNSRHSKFFCSCNIISEISYTIYICCSV